MKALVVTHPVSHSRTYVPTGKKYGADEHGAVRRVVPKLNGRLAKRLRAKLREGKL